jgi:hypothetical protein
MLEKLNKLVAKVAGRNSAHVLDALIAWELTAVATGAESKSARDYAAHHPALVVVLTVAPPILTAAAAKFRKAATQSAPPAPSELQPPAEPGA